MRPHRRLPLTLAVAFGLAVAGLAGPDHAAAGPAAQAVTGVAAEGMITDAAIAAPAQLEAITPILGTITTVPADAAAPAGQPLTSAAGDVADLVGAGVEALPAGGAATLGHEGATADGTAAAYTPYVERAWTTDRYGRPQTRFAQGDGLRFYFTAVNPSWNWQVAYLRLAARMDIVCITTPCIAPETVLVQGQKWFPPGRATYYLPLVVERNDTVGNWLIEATVGGTQAQARFQIVAGGTTPGGQNGVIVYSGAEYTGQAIVVGAGNWQLPTGFRPQSIRFSGAYAAGWRVDLYNTICPFVPPCTYHYVATYGNDQLDLGEVGTGPYRLSVHR